MMAKRRIRHLLVALNLVVPAAGCDSLLDSSQEIASDAQVLVTGTSPIPLMLVFSNDYTRVVDAQTGETRTTLARADTLRLDLPIDRTYPLGASARILVRLINPDSTVTADIHMRVLLDGKQEVYSQRASMRNATLEYVFAYY